MARHDGCETIEVDVDEGVAQSVAEVAHDYGVSRETLLRECCQEIAEQEAPTP